MASWVKDIIFRDDQQNRERVAVGAVAIALTAFVVLIVSLNS